MQPSPRSHACRQQLLPYAMAFLAVAALSTDLHAQRNRDSWQRVPDIMAALAIGAGSYVGDVGAGDGYFTRYLADAVGSTGRVYAVDISDSALSSLRRLVENEDFDNVDIVRGEVDNPNLDAESVDAILVVNAYHEMTEHEAMVVGMFDALKPGGRLVMLDFIPADASASRDEQTRSHDIGIDIAERELRAVGFEIVERYEQFADNGRSDQWMLVARR